MLEIRTQKTEEKKEVITKKYRSIPIDDEHKDLIDAALDTAQEGCKVRQASYDTVLRYVEKADEQLAHARIYSPSAKNGVIIHCNPHARIFPNAYKYTPFGTCFTIKHVSGKWKLVEAWRGYCNCGAVNEMILVFPDALKKKIVERLAKPYMY